MRFGLSAKRSIASSVGGCVTAPSFSLSKKRVIGDTRSSERNGPSFAMSSGERRGGSNLLGDGIASRLTKSSAGGILEGEAGSRSKRKVMRFDSMFLSWYYGLGVVMGRPAAGICWENAKENG